MSAYDALVKLSGQAENEIEGKLEKRLSAYFDVKRQVKSKCGHGRIDLILVHKNDDRLGFGIEVKVSGQKKGKDLGDWFKQIIRYQDYDFGRKIIVFVFPQVSHLYLSEGDLMNKHDVFRHDFLGAHNNVSTFLGAMGIGELQLYDYKNQIFYRLVYRGHIFWNSRKDILNVDAFSKYL